MPRGVLGSSAPSKYQLLERHESELVGQFIDSLGGLSPRRIKKYQFYLGKINSELSSMPPTTKTGRSRGGRPRKLRGYYYRKCPKCKAPMPMVPQESDNFPGVTDEQFEWILPLLPPAAKTGRPRSDLRQILNVIFLQQWGRWPRYTWREAAQRYGSKKSTAWDYYELLWKNDLWNRIKPIVIQPKELGPRENHRNKIQ